MIEINSPWIKDIEKFIEDAYVHSSQIRDKYPFRCTSRWNDAEKRFHRILESKNPDERGDDLGGDSKIRANLTTRMLTRAVMTVAPLLHENLMPLGMRPYGLIPKSLDANEKIEPNYQLIDTQLREMKFAREIGRFLYQAAEKGTGFLRCRVKRTQEMAKMRDRQSEKRRYRWQPRAINMPMVKSWSPFFVYLSNPELPDVADQESVIFYSMVGISELEASALNIGRDGDGFIRTGRFFNISDEFVSKITTEVSYKQNLTMGLQSLRVPGEHLSVEPSLEFLEYQGYLPLKLLLKNGKISQSDLDTLGIAKDDVENNLIWYADLLSSGEEKTNSHLSRLIGLRPCPYAPQKTELIKGILFPDEGNAYGKGLNDVGFDLEDVINHIANEKIISMIYNNNPACTVFEGALKNSDRQKTALEPGARIICDTLVENPESVIKPIRKDIVDPEVLAWFRYYNQYYEETTLSPRQLQGGEPRAGTTLGEYEMRIGRATGKLMYIIRGIESDAISEAIQSILEINYQYLDEAAVIKKVGMTGINWEQAENFETKNLTMDIGVIGTGSLSIGNRREQAMFKMQLAQQFPDVMDRKKALLEILMAIGEIHPRYWLNQDIAIDPLSPEDELELIENGVSVRPRSDENFQEHLQKHAEQMKNSEDQNILKYIMMHIQDTMQLRSKVEMMRSNMIPRGTNGQSAAPPGIDNNFIGAMRKGLGNE